MSQTLQLPNYDSLNIVETSELAADMPVAATTLTIKNPNNFTAGDFIIVGTLSSEGAELFVINEVSDETITVASAAKRPHGRFAAVTRLFGDKARIYRAANTDGRPPADDAFSMIDTVTIDYDQADTEYTDGGGSSDYWYKFTYFNSTNSLETNLASATPVRGGNLGNYCSIDDIKVEAGLKNNRYITASRINDKRKAAQDEINAALQGTYQVPFQAPINPLIADITAKLAAGFLLTSSYGPVNSFSTNNGTNKIEEARATLKRIDDGELVLRDAIGNDTRVPNTGGVTGWPNGRTATASPEQGGGDFMFKVADRY